MRASRLFFPTLRDDPSEAEVVSHRLLVRGGFIRKVAAGVYSYLPLGWRVHEKITAIVREEMNAIGGQEVFLSALVPKELLEESGRYGVDVLFPLQDRNRRHFVLGFTHEETITDIVRGEVRSWKQLPLILYQIQTKFRDEPRPRGGLLRGREFSMKDSYSFHADVACLDRVYRDHYRAYERIFKRCGLDCLVVDADPGDIGGSENREFMILAESGEDTILRCDACGYAANAERADIGAEMEGGARSLPAGDMASAQVVKTPGAHTVAQVCEFLGVEPDRLIKTIIVAADGSAVAALVRGDRELNLSKLRRYLGANRVELADAVMVERVTGASVGFAGPVGLKGVRIVADHELTGAERMVVGANQDDAHIINVMPDVDFAVSEWADIRVASAGDRCAQPDCTGRYREARGIEVGHIFQLGAKYTQAMGARVQTEAGENIDLLMGCYGLGISRVMAAAVEAHHDRDGICWPISIAPFEVVIILVNSNDAKQREAAEQMYSELSQRRVEVLYDDRDERSGVKFKDADLIGCSIRVVIGRALSTGCVEVTLRRDKAQSQVVPFSEAVDCVVNWIEQEHQRME